MLMKEEMKEGTVSGWYTTLVGIPYSNWNSRFYCQYICKISAANKSLFSFRKEKYFKLISQHIPFHSNVKWKIALPRYGRLWRICHFVYVCIWTGYRASFRNVIALGELAHIYLVYTVDIFIYELNQHFSSNVQCMRTNTLPLS